MNFIYEIGAHGARLKRKRCSLAFIVRALRDYRCQIGSKRCSRKPLLNTLLTVFVLSSNILWAIDFLGFIGIARDISRAPKDIKTGIKSIQTHREKLPDILTLDSSKRMAEERIKEMDIFLDKFFPESFNYF